MTYDLADRLFDFAVGTLKYLMTLPRNEEFKVVRYQLAKSSTSSGANYEEAQAGSSRKDFHNKTRIALKEMRESHYWLRILDAVIEGPLRNESLTCLLKEAGELKKILGSIVHRTREE